VNGGTKLKPIALSIPETGKALGGEGDPLSRNTIYRMIQRRELEAFKLGSRTMVTMASIEAVAASAPRLAAAA
jgi:hypothetical protein